MAAVSSSTIDSSALGLTSILRMTNRATLTSSASETSMPDSLETSMLINAHAMAHHIRTGQLGEVDVVDVVQDVDHRPQTGSGAAREIDLGDVSSHDDLGSEAQPGEEHFHLLGRGVLRLVEDDERIIKRAAPHVRQRRHLDHPGGHQLRDQLGI